MIDLFELEFILIRLPFQVFNNVRLFMSTRFFLGIRTLNSITLGIGWQVHDFCFLFLWNLVVTRWIFGITSKFVSTSFSYSWIFVKFLFFAVLIESRISWVLDHFLGFILNRWSWNGRRPKKYFWRLFIFIDFYIRDRTSFSWSKLISGIGYILFLFSFFEFKVTTKTSWFDYSWRFVQILMRLKYFRLNNLLIFDLSDKRFFILRTRSNRRLVWHHWNFHSLLFLDRIIFMRVATTFLVGDWWSLPFCFVKARTLEKLYIFVIFVFYLLDSFCNFLYPIIFFDVWAYYGTLYIPLAIFSIIFIFLLSVNHLF